MNESPQSSETSLSPLHLIDATYKAFLGSEKAPDESRELVVELPCPDFVPLLRVSDGLKLLREQRNPLIKRVIDLRETVTNVVYTICGIFWGDLFDAQEFRPNPELEVRLQEYSLGLRRKCSEPLRTTRVLGCYDSLNHLFHGAQEELQKMEMNIGCTEHGLADRNEDMLTNPDDLKPLGFTPIVQFYEELETEIKGALKKHQGGPGKAVPITIPEASGPSLMPKE